MLRSLARIAEEGKLTRIMSLAQGAAAGSATELQTMPLVQAVAQREIGARRELAELQSRFGPKHPAVQQAQSALAAARAALVEEIDRSVASLQANLATTRATEENLRVRVEAMQRAAIRDSAQEFATPQSADGSEQPAGTAPILDAQPRSGAGIAGSACRARIIDHAAAACPASVGLDPLLVGVLALCGGLLLGAAVATMLERLDNGFRTSNDVTACADMRCLGLVPELPPSDPLLTAPDRPALSTAQVMFDEAVRLVASSIGLFGAGHGGGGRVVLVTSAVPGEGRSTLCAGLARSLSLAGRRVLLIDGLPRRFDQTEPDEPTVTPETAEGTGVLQQMPQTKPDEGALVLLQRNSAAALSIDVFGSPHLAPALEQARKHFDVIIIEGPPVMLVADALVLGRMADTVVHVARWADTKRRTVLVHSAECKIITSLWTASFSRVSTSTSMPNSTLATGTPITCGGIATMIAIPSRRRRTSPR